MNKEKSEQLKQLILNEIAFRKEFRELRAKLESLVDPITNHVENCCQFWKENMPEAQEVIIIMDNGTTLKIVKPKYEVAKVESYLPYGIDFSECQVINVEGETK